MWRPEASILFYCSLIFELMFFETTTQIKDPSQNGSRIYEAHLVGLFTASSELPIYHNIMKATLEMAAEEAELRYPLIKFKMSVKKGPKICEKNYAAALAAQEYYDRKVDAFIGPACSVALDPVARMTSFWNIPIFTAGGIGTQFTNKRLYQTLTRLSFSLGEYRFERVN